MNHEIDRKVRGNGRELDYRTRSETLYIDSSFVTGPLVSVFDVFR